MISVVIPSYNRRDCLLRLLSDLYSQKDAEFEVIVVDDCSPDDTVVQIRKEFPQVRLFVNEVNGGPCVSRNRGIKEAKGEFILGLDSDVSLADPLLLSKVQTEFERGDESVGFAFRIYEPDGVTDDEPRWWHPQPFSKARDRVFETDYFSGTAYAFRRDMLLKAGLYPEILYMHYEEVELAYRILDDGGTIEYRPDFSVVHHANPVSRRNEISIFYKPRNQILIAMGCYPFMRGLRYAFPRMAFQFVKSIKGGHPGGFFRAIKSACELAPERLKNRQPLKDSTFRRIRSLKSEPQQASAGA